MPRQRGTRLAGDDDYGDGESSSGNGNGSGGSGSGGGIDGDGDEGDYGDGDGDGNGEIVTVRFGGPFGTVARRDLAAGRLPPTTGTAVGRFELPPSMQRHPSPGPASPDPADALSQLFGPRRPRLPPPVIDVELISLGPEHPETASDEAPDDAP